MVALVWTEENRIASYRQQLPPIEQFRPAYCQALYPTAKALFQEGHRRQALTICQEMHTLHCRQPTAYFLDAAECFLALHQPQDARRMGQAGLKVMQRNQGALQRLLDGLGRLMSR